MLIKNIGISVQVGFVKLKLRNPMLMDLLDIPDWQDQRTRAGEVTDTASQNFLVFKL